MFFSSRMKLFPSASPLSKTNDVDPKLISCIGPLRLPRSLSVCCRVPTVVRQIGTNKSWIYSLTEAASALITPWSERPYARHRAPWASPLMSLHLPPIFFILIEGFIMIAALHMMSTTKQHLSLQSQTITAVACR